VSGDIALSGIVAAANGGNSTAQYIVGLAYQHGIGVEEDEATAVEWFSMSSAQDNPAGTTSLAYMLTFEQFQDLPRALALFRAASDQGYAKAKSQLGYYLITGELGQEDQDQAVALFREASQAGHVFATYALGQYGDGERKNAEMRLEELAAAGDPEGDNWLCEMRYVQQDYARMASACEGAALTGYAAPRAIYAGMLARGDGVERDRDQARYWARLALTQLDPVRREALYDYTRRLIR
jgi:TPR repeat protein